jgi:hypothetical protein
MHEVSALRAAIQLSRTKRTPTALTGVAPAVGTTVTCFRYAHGQSRMAMGGLSRMDIPSC